MSKGDRNRVKDHKVYRESWDRIFGQGDKKPTEESLGDNINLLEPETEKEAE